MSSNDAERHSIKKKIIFTCMKMSHGAKSDKYAGYSYTVICFLAKSLFVLAFRKARFRDSQSSSLVNILPFEGNKLLRRICG